MTSGILIFAHNSESLSYILLATVSGKLAKKHLNVPVSIVTDLQSIEDIKNTIYYDAFTETFDQVIIVDAPQTTNTRNLQDGNTSQIVPFVNSNRASAWELTPYDRTLLIDSDFLIFSDHLNTYWNTDLLLINSAINDISTVDRLSYNEKYVSDTSIRLLWATNVMFTKNKESKIFFDLVEHIRENYLVYRELYNFETTQYRNDISFSIAHHILTGYISSQKNLFPLIFTTIDKDILHQVKENGTLIFLIAQQSGEFAAASMKNVDIHVMNKKSILRNVDSLLRLAE